MVEPSLVVLLQPVPREQKEPLLASKLVGKLVPSLVLKRVKRLASLLGVPLVPLDSQKEAKLVLQVPPVVPSRKVSKRAHSVKSEELVSTRNSVLSKPSEWPKDSNSVKPVVLMLLVVPLIDQQGTLGALVLLRRATGEFAASIIGLMRTFANQAVLAMRNARLFTEVDQKGR